MIMLTLSTLRAFYFDEINVIDFLNKYEDLCYDFRFNNLKKVQQLSQYCEVMIEQFIEIIQHWIDKNWKQFRKILFDKYKHSDVI